MAELVPTSRHCYELRLGVDENPSGCRRQGWFYQDYSMRGAGLMYQTLLEAIGSGLRLRIYVTGNCNLDGYAEFASIGVVRAR